MNVLQYPRPTRLLPNTACPQVNGSNTVTCVSWSDVNFPPRESSLSIKCVLKGEVTYESAGARFAVTPETYLVLNHGQCYSGSIEPGPAAETLTLFFKRGFAEETLRSLITPADHLMDAPAARTRQPVLFFEKLYPHDDLLWPVIASLRAALLRNETAEGWYEEQFYLILERLLLVHRNIGKEIAGLPAVRASTRSEMYRRLHRARDYMEASLGSPLTLEEIAEVAWFSPFHFLRAFKQTFHITPHQYLTSRRIEKAKRLLRQTEQPVTDICYTVGFESLGSFSSLFRHHVGLPPEQYRKANRK